MRVFVYKNLHKDCWSIKALDGEHKGRVVGHSRLVTVRNAEFKVSEAGRRRVISEGRKNVHAGVVGELMYVAAEVEWRYPVSLPRVGTLSEEHHEFSESMLMKHSYNKLVTYNPYKYNSFVCADTEVPIHNALTVSLFPRNVVANTR